MRVGILGCGNVGSALVRLDPRARRRDRGARRACRSRSRGSRCATSPRTASLPLPARCFTDDAAAVVGDPDVDIVVEVIGGIEPARSLIVEALMAGKPVVTANKELLATHGRELFETAEGAGVDFLFEASVGRRHPAHPAAARVARRRPHPARDGHRQRHHQLHPHPHERRRCVVRRRARGGAGARLRREPIPPPTSRASTPRRRRRSSRRSRSARAVVAGDVYREGITGITLDDIASARDLGYVVKLLAVAEELDGEVAVRVHPAMVPVRHPLASVRDSFNAVFIEGDAVGELMLYGRGAGGGPTASAVLGDLVDAAKNLVEGRKGATVGALAAEADPRHRRGRVAVLPADRGGRPPGRARARSPTEFGRHGVSIRSMKQRGIGRRRPPHLRHAQGPRGRPPRHGRRAAATSSGAPRRLGAPGDGRGGMSSRRWPG